MTVSVRLEPAARRRLENCLALAKRGATPGERAAALAAAERIASTLGLTLADAKAQIRGSDPDSGTMPPRQPRTGHPVHPWAQPKEPVTPVTVEELRRQKAETEAWRRKRTAAADRRLSKELAEQAVWEEQQRAEQAARDVEWVARQGSRGPQQHQDARP